MAKDVESLTIVLLVLSIVAAAGGLALAPDWRRQVSLLGVSVAVGAVVALIGYHLARSAVVGQVTDPDTRAAVEAAWDTFLDGLQTALLIAAAAAVILAAATRAVVRPVLRIERPLEEAWRRLTTVPERPAARAARGAILVALGLLIVLNRDAAIELAVLAVGLYVLYKGVEELLRLIAPPPEAAPAPAAAGCPRLPPAPPRGARRRRRCLRGRGQRRGGIDLRHHQQGLALPGRVQRQRRALRHAAGRGRPAGHPQRDVGRGHPRVPVREPGPCDLSGSSTTASAAC